LEETVKKLLLFTLTLLLAASARAQSTSGTWTDVTASPYNAKNDCSADAGPAINSAITNGPGNMVLFFPVGCYLISTQIVDARTSGGTIGSNVKITYFGYGAEFRASSTSPPTNSIIKFGNDSTTIRYRTIQGIFFNCNNDAIDGVDLDGLTYSEFDGITISQCAGTADMRTVGTNNNNYTNKVVGGYIYATGSTNGVQLANNYTATNLWTFYGTVFGGYGGGSTGTAIDFNGAGGGIYSADIEGWSVGLKLGYSNQYFGAHGFTVTGSYFESNTYAIVMGSAGYASGYVATGINVTSNYINCNNVANTYGVDILQANGFSITGNRFNQCTVWAINGDADGTYQGADNGFISANEITGGNGIQLLGSNNTVTNSIATKSANYTLSGADSWINATGGITVTVPHAMTGQRWTVFNSGSTSITLACDSGKTINGASFLFVSSETGKTVTTDGTNCFAQ
jgi:hypothetical protein